MRTSSAECAIQITRRASRSEPAQCCFFAPDFALNDTQPWLIGQRIPLDLSLREWPTVLEHKLPDEGEFAHRHAEILRLISAGRLVKVVPMVSEELRFAEPLQPEVLAHTVFGEWPHQYSYGFSLEGEGLCGITPELLFSVSAGQLETMALAGTASADGPCLLEDPKERHEHQLVVDHIHAELKDLGRLEVGATSERIYGRLKHLYTPISVALKASPTFEELVHRLHPTAALGGWPRRPAWQWLSQQSFHHERARFGAPFGWQERDQMQCVVAIRCLQWWDERALLCAGCGVVSASDSGREWRELGLKRQAIHQMLGVPT